MKIMGKKLYNLSASQKGLTDDDFPPDKYDVSHLVGFHAYMETDCRLDLLEKCWNRIAEMHDALRLRMVGRIFRKQYIEPYAYEKLPVKKVNGWEGFKELEKEERSIAVRMFGGALYRAILVDCGNGAGGMIACLHNICCDGYSLGMIFEEMESLYAAALRGEEFPPYKEYSFLACLEQDQKYRHSDAWKEDLKWWSKKYREMRDYTFPVDPPVKEMETELAVMQVSSDQYEKLTAFCKENSILLTSAVMSVLAYTTYVLTKNTCFSFLNLSHGRRTYAMKHTLGCMTTANPVFFRIDTTLSFSQMARRDYMEYLEGLNHGRMPESRYVFCNYFLMLEQGNRYGEEWMSFSSMNLGAISADSKLGLEVFDEGELEDSFYCAAYDMPDHHAIRLELNYQSAKYTAGKMEEAKETFEKVLDWCLEHPDQKLQNADI